MLAAIAPSISAGSERPPSDPSEWQAFAFFAHQSHQARQRDRKTKHVPHSRNAITFVSFDGPSVHRKERCNSIALSSCRCPPTMVPPEALLAPPKRHNFTTKQKTRMMVGKKFIYTLLANLSHRANASHG